MVDFGCSSVSIQFCFSLLVTGSGVGLGARQGGIGLFCSSMGQEAVRNHLQKHKHFTRCFVIIVVLSVFCIQCWIWLTILDSWSCYSVVLLLVPVCAGINSRITPHGLHNIDSCNAKSCDCCPTSFTRLETYAETHFCHTIGCGNHEVLRLIRLFEFCAVFQSFFGVSLCSLDSDTASYRCYQPLSRCYADAFHTKDVH